MQFTTSMLALGLAIGAVATPTLDSRTPSLVKRDIDSIVSVISDITTQVKGLASAIESYSGGDIADIQAASDKIVSTTEAGVATVKASDVLADIDAVGLVQPVTDLSGDITSAVDALIAKKDQVAAANAGPATYKDLQDQLAAASSLADALTSKVSSNLQSTAAGLSAKITAAIQKGIDAFKDISTGGGSGTSTGGSAPTSSGGAAPTSSGSAEPTSTGSPTTYPAGTGGAHSTGSGVSPPTSSSTAPITNGAGANAVSGVLAGVVGVAAILAF